jgi:hypothetical protein
MPSFYGQRDTFDYFAVWYPKKITNKQRLAVLRLQSITKASTSRPLRSLTSEFGWDLVFYCVIWPIAQLIIFRITLRPKKKYQHASHNHLIDEQIVIGWY